VCEVNTWNFLQNRDNISNSLVNNWRVAEEQAQEFEILKPERLYLQQHWKGSSSVILPHYPKIAPYLKMSVYDVCYYFHKTCYYTT
jgi:hypothetical protein